MTEEEYLQRERENIVEFDGKEPPYVARRVAEDEARERQQKQGSLFK